MTIEVLEAARRRIEAAIPARDKKTRAPVVEHLALRALAVTDGLLETTPALITALLRAAAEARISFVELEQGKQALIAACAAAPNPARLREVLIEFLERQESHGVDHVKDRAALNRWLDRDALLDRLGVQLADAVDEVEVAYVAATELVGSVAGREVMALQTDILLKFSFEMAETSGPEILRVAPLRFVGALMHRFDASERFMVLGLGRHRQVKELATNGFLDCWSRIAAFEILRTVAPDDALELIEAQIVDLRGRDGMVVRNNLLRLTYELAISTSRKVRVLWSAHGDPSEHVRQGIARQLAKLEGRPSAERMVRLVVEDPSPRVRAFALRELSRRAIGDFEGARAFLEALGVIVPRFASEPDAISRLETRVVFSEMRSHVSQPGGVLAPRKVVELLQPVLAAGVLSLDFLEEAAGVLVAAEVYNSPRLLELRNLLFDEVQNMAEGQRRDVHLLPGVTARELERALLTAVRGGLTFSVSRFRGEECRIAKGEKRSLALWRVVNELRNPAPDKREAYPHTAGRSSSDEMVVPPFQMGEVTPTRVPGERRQIDAIQGWGVFLPLMDDFLAALDSPSGERRVVTSFGTLVIAAPRPRWGRIRARLKASFHYAHYAHLREVSLGGGTEKDRRQFTVAVRALGFSLRWEHQQGNLGEAAHCSLATPAVARYFGLLLLPTTPSWVDAIVDEVLRPTGNTAWHLAIVVWVMLSYMVVRGAWIRATTERSRARVPLTVGGWGSRGKSGSERIKAALFHALRYDTVVKTTGCEAMFIHARRDLPAREIYVYRPYGKATIWEQGKLLKFADKLHAQVFLWECMALRPQFVQLLEHEWMKDDITTLTNAYPDHEDVMGPSGEDVARVIGSFGSKNGVVFTAEQELLPVIEEIGRAQNSIVHATTEIDAELLPQDMLERFPYAEHPRNVALILAVAEHLGVDHEWALVKMADHTVPDLGVLKTYPTVRYLRRTLTFSNGMSANERAGFMSNWRRLGYNRIDVDENPESVIVAVVNNRGDRVPRSRVFAELLTRDVACDLVCVIGSNVGGMGGFLEESLDGWLPTLGLGDGEPGQAEALLEQHCVRMRVPRHHETLRARLRLVLDAAALNSEQTDEHLVALAGTDPAGRELSTFEPLLGALRTAIESQDLSEVEGTIPVESFVGAARQLIEQYIDSKKQLQRIREELSAGEQASAEKAMRAWFRKAFLARVQLIMDYHATGDQVIDLFTRRVPPGHHCRVLGCQNIKGTGLDFAYRWVSVGQVDGALTRLETDPMTRGESIGWLAGHADWGLMDVIDAARRLTAIQGSDDATWSPYQGQIETLLSTVRQMLRQKLGRLGKAPERTWLQKLLDRIEPFVDHLDAIHRYKLATKIMDELFVMRISQGRAGLLLRQVTDRGHGGWLAEDVGRWVRDRKERVFGKPKVVAGKQKKTQSS